MISRDFNQLESLSKHSRNKARDKLFSSKSDTQPKHAPLSLRATSRSP